MCIIGIHRLFTLCVNVTSLFVLFIDVIKFKALIKVLYEVKTNFGFAW